MQNKKPEFTDRELELMDILDQTLRERYTKAREIKKILEEKYLQNNRGFGN